MQPQHLATVLENRISLSIAGLTRLVRFFAEQYPESAAGQMEEKPTVVQGEAEHHGKEYLAESSARAEKAIGMEASRGKPVEQQGGES